MAVVTHSVTCLACGEPLPDGHAGPCPKCGDLRKRHKSQIGETARAGSFVGYRHIHEYYERHPLILSLVVIVSLGSPFLGLIFAGWPGVVIGLAISVVTFFAGLKAIIKVREIKEGH